MSSIGYYRFATIAHDTIVFVCEDDLWSVPRSGGTARRLTASPADLSTPRLSPDGSTIAFVARDEGHPEVYVMPTSGGPVKRLTYLGGEACAISGWSHDGASILFCSDASSPFSKETHGFRVPASGGAPEALELGHLRAIDIRPDGRTVIGRNSEDPARWKRYRGGTAGDLWIDREGNGTYARLISLAGNPVWPMWVGERVYFLADHEGVGNIYSVTTSGDDLRRHTNESTYYARFPSSDGRSIVYTAGGVVKVLDPIRDVVETIAIEAPSTAPQTVRRFVDAVDDLESFEPSPDGTSIAIVSRGRAFTMPLWEEAAVSHGSGSRERLRLASWLPDSKRFVVVSDASGRETIEVRDALGESEPIAVTHDDIGRIVELAVSPVADVVAIANHRHEVLIVDCEERKVRRIDASPASLVHDLAFSPDGRWLAYALAVAPAEGIPANPDTSIVRIAKVKSGAVHDVTPLLRADASPAWDPEGRYLYFISTRDFNPVYDALQFDLSFPQASRPFVVTLRSDVPSPFVPKPGPLHKRDDNDAGDDDDKKRDEKPPHITIDFDGIQGRILGFPVDEGDYSQIVAARDRVFFTRFPKRGIKPAGSSWNDEPESGTLVAYDFETQRSVKFQSDVEEVVIGADARTMLYSSHDRIRAIDVGGDLPDDDHDEPSKPADQPGRRSGWIDLSRASVLVEPLDEWSQMYREAWRMQGEQFWDPAMSGIDWALVRDRYAALLPLVRTRVELSDVIWEMQGELGTSHAYEIGGDYRRAPQYKRGFLGADLAWDDDIEGYRIRKIYRGDSWNRDADSPLAEPGLDVREGDAIYAIGGRPLSKSLLPDELLVNSAGRDVALTVGTKKSRRRVVVHALHDDRMLRYRAWVEKNRALVHERTGGRVGYVHIPDMGPWGFSEFHRGYLSEFNREALVVDVRYNRGGHVSPLLLEKLARKRVGYDVSRYGPPMPYPPESVAGPIVALTNQFAGSDGDIFSHCFKMYSLGPLVGKRTWGGVIGINPYHRLVDGTITTQPEYSFWFADVGWKVENYGTDPDYDVDIAPHDDRVGADPQMEKALELIGALLSSSRNGKPHFDARPQLTLPAGLAISPA